MLPLSTTVSTHPDVVGTTLESGETVLMHMGTASYFTLNSSGTDIWTLLTAGRPLSAICEQLVATYNVSTEQAASSVQRLVMELAAAALLTIPEIPEKVGNG